MEFVQITDIDSADFKAATDIYLHSFPVNERQALETIKERIGKGLNQLYIGRADNEVVFVALLWPLSGTDFILLDYMATHALHRGKSIASLFMQSI
ncbi:MAG TPA: hypothetical protein VD996_12810, partial [Chitinophagaceae bacterium]|nr:hypothetical protein [Chitinophagaceae bacterium]